MDNPKSNRSLVSVFSIMAGIYGYAMVHVFGVAGLVVVLGLGLSMIVGDKLTVWYAKNRKVDVFLASVIMWSNLIAWIIPILGAFVAGITLKLGEQFPKESKKYYWLGGIGCFVTLACAAIGLFLRLNP